MFTALALFAVTLVCIFVRPRGIKEVWFAMGGALLAWIFGLVDPEDAVELVHETGDVLLFLLGMLVVAYVTDQAGVFARLARFAGRAARGRGRLLFAGIYLIGVLVTMWLSLDTTAVILAPIVFSLARSLGVPPLPFVFATTYVANTASLFLPVSNLTNLIVLGRLSVPFWEYARVMFLPSVFAVVANLLLLLWLFRTSIPKRYDSRGPGSAASTRGVTLDAASAPATAGIPAASAAGIAPAAANVTPTMYGVAPATAGIPAAAGVAPAAAGVPVTAPAAEQSLAGAQPVMHTASGASLPVARERESLIVTVCGLVAVLIGLAVAPFWNMPLWGVACVGAAVLAAYHLTRAGLPAGTLVRDISWDLLPFVFSLFLLLRGVAKAGLSEWAAGIVTHWAAGQSLGELLIVAAATAIGSNLINNLPMVLVAVESLAVPVSTGELTLASLYAALIGTNIGPNLTVIGSLATMLSLSIIGKKGLTVSGLTYLKIGLISVPVLLVAAVFGLWLSL